MMSELILSDLFRAAIALIACINLMLIGLISTVSR